jgi:hypothetical protein
MHYRTVVGELSPTIGSIKPLDKDITPTTIRTMPMQPEANTSNPKTPESWASLPNHERNDPSTKAFKKRLAVIIGVYVGTFLIFLAVILIAFFMLRHSSTVLQRP